ncbi:MAG: acetyl-CoA acetyltransferase, partial [Pseudomonadota bacterium]
GLPFFGGPGNNYSMHAIVQLAHRLRRRSQGLGLIGANGGFLSKHAVGLYSASSPTTPFQRVLVDNNAAHHGGSAPPVLAMQANGRGRVETFAVSCSCLGPTRGFVIGRLEDNRRFVAVTDPNDKSTPAIMASRDLIGETLFVSNSGSGNRFSLPASVGD